GSGCGIVPVMSPDGVGGGIGVAACGIGTEVLSGAPGAGALNDCRPIGVGDVIEGIAGAGAGLALSAGAVTGGSLDISVSGAGGCCVALSSSVIPILNVPSTITTTLAPTSSERIFDVMFEDPLAASLAASL